MFSSTVQARSRRVVLRHHADEATGIGGMRDHVNSGDVDLAGCGDHAGRRDKKWW